MNYDEAIKALQKIESFHAYDGQFDNELKVIFSFIETAKKEHELLGLYRNHHYHLMQGNTAPMLRLRDKIIVLEEELK